LELEGTVFDDDRRPLAGASVTTDAKGPSTTTDAFGRFTLRGLSPGSVRVTARLPGHPSATATADAGATRVELILGRAGGLRGDARDAQTLGPLLAFRVRAAGPDDVAVERSFEKGEFTLPALTPGRWKLTISARGYATRELTVDVTPGDPTPVR